MVSFHPAPRIREARGIDALYTTSAAVGLAVLLYDHILTFADEIELIWPAPATYAKYMFLLNRYIVLGTLLAVAYGACFSACACSRFPHSTYPCVHAEMCGFAGAAFTE